MREIKFRGKQRRTGKWFYGNLYVKDIYGRTHICTTKCGCFDIDPETVGQDTGLTDKNGIKIFEGDIVKGKDNLERNLAVSGYIDHENGSFVIVGEFMTHYRWLDYELEVIGNIYDNKEILDVK